MNDCPAESMQFLIVYSELGVWVFKPCRYLVRNLFSIPTYGSNPT